MYEVTIRTHFAGAHHLRDYPGSCANVHGHNWEVEVTVQGEALNALGMLVDFRELKQKVAQVLARLDHTDLNALPDFATTNPTSENLAGFLYHELAACFHGVPLKVGRVLVRETPDACAVYWE